MLPPDELLSSHLRQISSPDGRLHAIPAWLGYGTLISRERAVRFLETFLSLEQNPESIQMADNFYSILSNTIPELWFGQETELGLGQPFTAGTSGDDRNWRYMEAAKSLLEKTLNTLEGPMQFIDKAIYWPQSRIWRAPCRNQLCVIETNIKLLPELPYQTNQSLRELDSARRQQVVPGIGATFINSPLSHAVDQDMHTSFCSYQGSEVADFLQLDLFRNVTVPLRISIDGKSVPVLETVVKQFSDDGSNWQSAQCQGHENWVCTSKRAWRFFRITFETSVQKPWCIRELYV